MEVLRLLVLLISSFSRTVAPFVPDILTTSWELFVTCWPIYQTAVVAGSGDLDEAEVGTLVCN